MKLLPRYFRFQSSFPLLLILILLAYEYTFTKKENIKVNISYPVYSMSPHLADDWSSFFVMNHVYRRFSSKKGFFRSLDFLKTSSLTCKNQKSSILSSECPRVQITYELHPDIVSCSGRRYLPDNFKYELETIALKKNWLLPNFSWCKNKSNCFEFDNTQNIQNRLDSIYLRFGWSLSSPADGIYGLRPTCFKTYSTKDVLQEGVIESPLQNILITTVDKDVDLYLYENSSQSEVYKNINFYNPIYYFLILNGSSLSNKTWVNKEIEIALQTEFQNYRFISKIQNEISHINFYLPNKLENYAIPKIKKTIVIPNYLENCLSISNNLNRNSLLHKWNIEFECTNITEFVERIVKTGNGNWDGFISPLTPGFPGKESFSTQYFNENSVDSWLGKMKPKNSLVHFLGVSHGTMTISKSFCSIKPNSLGLSDFTIDDLSKCQ